VSESDPKVNDLENFVTPEANLYFWVKDSTGKYESGKPTCWRAELKIRHQIQPAVDKRKVTLQCIPAAEMTYTLDGSNPKDGKLYESPFEIGHEAITLLVYAKAGEATKTKRFQIPHSSDKTVQIDNAKPARLNSGRRIALDTTDQVFGVINHFRDQNDTLFKGVRIEIGEGENTVTVRFQEREITAAIIEGTVNCLRDVLHDAQASVAITVSDGIQFDTGFEVWAFAELAGMQLRQGDVVQED
jgi:hypothetical protein